VKICTAPIGPRDAEQGMLISGYYVPQQRVNPEAFLGVLEWGKAKGRATEVRESAAKGSLKTGARTPRPGVLTKELQ
jgi:hypothetical protein